MALPYPEGEVFFKRSVLKKNGNGLDPDNLSSFNSHALVEWCWNDGAFGSTFGRNIIEYVAGKHEKDKRFAHWESMMVLFGTKEGFENPVKRESDGAHYSRHSGIERVVKTKLPGKTEGYEKRAKGGPLMTAVTPIKLDPNQPYMFIDLNFPIRAVYFPLAQKPSTMFPDLCSYLMVDFRMRQGVEMFDDVKQYDPLSGVPTKQQQDEHTASIVSAITGKFTSAASNASTASTAPVAKIASTTPKTRRRLDPTDPEDQKLLMETWR